MFDLTRFGLSDTFEVSAAVPDVVRGAATLRDAAGRLTRYFTEQVVDKQTGERSLALVQCFLACPFGHLPAELQAAAVTASAGVTPQPRQLCLTLLGAAGDGPAMGDPRLARPTSTAVVPSEAANLLAPWLAHIVERLDRDDPTSEVLRKVGSSYAVGYVTNSAHSEILTGWSDVALGYGILSVLSVTARFGSDRLVTLGLCSKTPIPERTAEAFAAVAIGLKLALLERIAFDIPDLGGEPITPRPGRDDRDQATALLQSQNETLHELLRVRHQIAVDESGQLEQALELAESRSQELAASQTALAGSEARGSAIVGAAIDAVVVMDASGRILEWNPAAEATFGYTRDECLGEVLGDLIVPDDLRHLHTQGIQRYLATGEGSLLGHRVETAALRRDGTTFPVELTITAVAGEGRPLFTGFIRDVTDLREHQAALLASREGFAHIARSLQRSLFPAILPKLPGVELGAVFHPSRAGSDVGGDFYDVFPVGRTDLLLTLGDVCGKGAEAAAITSIARHTIRAVAQDVRHPASILRRVNTVLQEHDIGERFCSVVTARAIPIVRGLRLSVCCAGHERPLVIRADGRVDRVGVTGQLLGLFPDVRLLEETVQLAHGDTLVLFTDGVTEARRDGEQFGEHRLAAALLDVQADPVAGMVNHLLEEVLAFGGNEPRDDIAVLAVRSVAR